MKRSRSSVGYAFTLAFVLLAAAPAAHARNVNAPADNVIAVHGLDAFTSHKDDINWVRNSYFTNHSLAQMCGNGVRCAEAAVVAYDGKNKGWDDHDFDSPGCYIARKARDIPGINIAVIGHSMGGLAAVHMIKDVATGFSGGWSCGIDTPSAASWILNIHTIGSPFEGSGVADVVFNRFSCLTCLAIPIPTFWAGTRSVNSVRTGVAGAKFDTWLANTGSWPVFTSWGTSPGALAPLAVCGCVASPSDGIVSEASARASHHAKPSSWHLGITKAVNHTQEVDGNTRACGSFSCNTTTAQDIWHHDPY
jgi:hypothetical protein